MRTQATIRRTTLGGARMCVLVLAAHTAAHASAASAQDTQDTPDAQDTSVVEEQDATTIREEEELAAPEEDASTVAARLSFHVGVECADRGDWECAVAEFEEARALRASPVIVTNHAIALVNVGRLVDAAEAFGAVARDPSAPRPLRAAATREIASLSRRIGQLSIQVVGASIGLAFSIDDRMIAVTQLGAPVPVDPGERIVRARRGDVVVAEASVQVEPGESASVELMLVPRDGVGGDASLGAAVLADPQAISRSHEERWVAAIVGLAVGIVVGVAVGVGVAHAFN